jgi:hypothetical protein
MSGGRLDADQLRKAVERAQARVRAKRPGDEEQARFWLRVFENRLKRAETEGTA